MRHKGNVKVCTTTKESGSYENNFSELAMQQNMSELNTTKDQTRRNLTLGIKQLSANSRE